MQNLPKLPIAANHRRIHGNFHALKAVEGGKQEELLDACNYIEKLKSETTDILVEKIMRDYLEEDSPITNSPDPGPPESLGTQTISKASGDIQITYTTVT